MPDILAASIAERVASLVAGDLVKVMFRVESTPAHDESMWVEVVSPGHGELAGIPIYVPLAHGAPVAFEAHHVFEIFRVKK